MLLSDDGSSIEENPLPVNGVSPSILKMPNGDGFLLLGSQNLGMVVSGLPRCFGGVLTVQ